MVYLAVRAYQRYREFATEYQEQVRQEVQKRISIVSEELHDGVYYWFDKTNDNFIAQGQTAEEIVEHIRHRYKTDHVFVLPGLERALVTPGCQVVDITNLNIKI